SERDARQAYDDEEPKERGQPKWRDRRHDAGRPQLARQGDPDTYPRNPLDALRARKNEAASVERGDRRERDDDSGRVRISRAAPCVKDERRKQCEGGDKPDNTGRRRDVEDPVMCRRIRRVHAGDPEPLRLLVTRVRDREVLEADAEERMVEENPKRGVVEQDAVTQADPATDVEQAAPEWSRHERDDEREQRHRGREAEPGQGLARQSRPSQPERRDDSDTCGDPEK